MPTAWPAPANQPPPAPPAAGPLRQPRQLGSGLQHTRPVLHGRWWRNASSRGRQGCRVRLSFRPVLSHAASSGIATSSAQAAAALACPCPCNARPWQPYGQLRCRHWLSQCGPAPHHRTAQLMCTLNSMAHQAAGHSAASTAQQHTARVPSRVQAHWRGGGSTPPTSAAAAASSWPSMRPAAASADAGPNPAPS